MLDTWRTMTMRATGSHDILLEGVFVPEVAVSLRRPKGKWHPFFTTVTAVAMPLIMSVYLGVAEAARDLVLREVGRKRDDPDVWSLVGEMENALVTAQMAVQGMVDICADYSFAPVTETANGILTRKTIAAQALLLTAEKALETVGGAGLYRDLGLERLVRDLHGAQFHPLQAKRQHRFTGRVAARPRPHRLSRARPGGLGARLRRRASSARVLRLQGLPGRLQGGVEDGPAEGGPPGGTGTGSRTSRR